MSIPRIAVAALTAIPLATSIACAQDYPSKPVRIITAAAGGGADFISRQIAQGVTLGQPIVVDNRATGALVGEVTAKAPPDGYTLMVAGATLWIAPLLRKLPYDVVRDFAPISLLVREIFMVAVHPSIPAKSVKELIALAKARPGELNYSTSSAGGAQHLMTDLFASMAGIKIVHVPYKGNAPAITALLSGEVQMTIIDATLVTPHLKQGRLRALAVTTATPSVLYPDFPTVAASGLPGYEAGSVSGLWAPMKTPDPIINRVSQEVVRLLQRPEVKERFLNAQVEVVASTPAQFDAMIKSDIAKWAKVIKDADIKVE